MKIQIPLLNAVRFTTDDDTALHLHTGHVDPLNDLVAELDIGPKVYLRTVTPADKPPLLDTATPYGHGKTAMTAFQFGQDSGEPNYATTARSATPVLPEELDITDELRISLFFRPDASSTGGKALIAGVPGRFGLYQDDRMLVLRLKSGGAWTEDLLDYELEIGSWHLLEVQWSKDLNEGRPMWYVNGVRGLTFMDALTSSLDSTGDRFNLAWDSEATASPTWQGAIREIELSRKAVWKTDEDGTDAEMRGRAMRLFGLAAHATPVPVFSRASVAWVRVGGVLHKVSQHHPRATALGSVVEEERENLNSTSTSVPALLTMNKGRYTLWFEQESDVDKDPTTLSVTVGSEESEEVEEDEPLVFEVLEDGTSVTITEQGEGTVSA